MTALLMLSLGLNIALMLKLVQLMDERDRARTNAETIARWARNGEVILKHESAMNALRDEQELPWDLRI